MVNWWWLIPAFIVGGWVGYAACCIFSVNRDA